jgi:hypothetical protein
MTSVCCVRPNPMSLRLLDRLVVLWVMPPVGFVITVLQTPELGYLIAYYVLAAVLASAIAVRWWQRAPSRWSAYCLLLAALLATALLGIEWVHFLAGRKTIDDLTDLRIIFYSSLYGSIVIFLLYAIYLTTLDGGQRTSHLGFFVRLMSWFHFMFLGYWLLLYGGWLDPIPKADLLHANSIAYGALFVLCVIVLFRRAVGLGTGAFVAFLAVNTAVILVNQTRGAIIGLVAMTGYLFFEFSGNRKRIVLMLLALGAVLGGGILAALAEGTLVTQVLGKDADSLGAVLGQISDAYGDKTHYVDISPDLVHDERSLSAFSRIGSNYYSLLSFLDNPVLGIGQAESYSIKVLGSGVHSLHFLIANSTGLLGLGLFAAMLGVILAAQGRVVVSGRFAAMLVLFFGYVLVFINSMPVYFSLVLTLLASQQATSHCGTSNMASDCDGRRRAGDLTTDGE